MFEYDLYLHMLLFKVGPLIKYSDMKITSLEHHSIGIALIYN